MDCIQLRTPRTEFDVYHTMNGWSREIFFSINFVWVLHLTVSLIIKDYPQFRRNGEI